MSYPITIESPFQSGDLIVRVENQEAVARFSIGAIRGIKNIAFDRNQVPTFT